jgi:hypothetical protein
VAKLYATPAPQSRGEALRDPRSPIAWRSFTRLHTPSGKTIKHPEWEWADLDGTRLAWVSQGLLYAAALDDTGLTNVKTLHDFNHMPFEAIEAPY